MTTHVKYTRVQHIFFLLLLIIVSMLLGCASAEDRGYGEESVALRFLQARSLGERNPEAALQQYNELLSEYAGDLPVIVEAEYEIAFLHYKQEKYVQARGEFAELIARYEFARPDVDIPGWPLYLSRKILLIMDQKQLGVEESEE